MKSRKTYSPRDKVELLQLHLTGQASVAAVCRQYKIHPTVLYRWQRQLFSRGHLLFQRRSPAKLVAGYREKIPKLRGLLRGKDRELARLQKQMAELVAALQQPPPPAE